MFRLLYDADRKVLLTQLSGVFAEEDIFLRDRQVARFVARHGLARGLMDYSCITRVDAPMDVIVRRSQAPPMLPGQTRVVVASTEPAYSLNRVIVAHQYYSRKVEPLVVNSLQDAYYALGGRRFDFVPVEEDEHMRLDRVALAALAAIDAQGKQADYSLRVLTESQQASTWIARHGLSFIRVSDLLNTMLRHAQLSDNELYIRCPGCRSETSLAECPLLGRRQTTYRCPTCRARLVELVPMHGGSSFEASGYSLAGFDVRTRADISCYGIVLPKSPKTDASGRR